MVLIKYFLQGTFELAQMLPKHESFRLQGFAGGLYMIIVTPGGLDYETFEKKLLDFSKWQDEAPGDGKTYNISKVLPVYIGQTSNFLNRFHQHISSSDGSSKLNQCKNLTIPGGIPRKNVYFLCRVMKPANAKFMESIFLRTFDFALNEEEQQNKRRESLLPSPEEEERCFCKAYQDRTNQRGALRLYGESKRMLANTIKKGKKEINDELLCADKICKENDNWSAI